MMNVLIGYDGSTFADAALDDLRCAGLPAQIQATVLSVADVFSPPPSPSGEAIAPRLAAATERMHLRVNEAMAEARTLAERAASRLRTEFPNWEIKDVAVADSPAWALLNRSGSPDGKGTPADLIVLGEAGRSALGRAVFGSVALKVLTHARCSVRIGRAGSRAGTGAPVRIVIGVDGSTDSTRALREVGGRAWPPGTQCRVVTVSDSQLLTVMPGMDPLSIPAASRSAIHLADEAADFLRKAGWESTPVVKEGAPATMLIQEAESFGADCIFVGARGLRTMERFLLGSVSSAVAMRAPCTVEVVHA